MKIAIGSDQKDSISKQKIKEFLENDGHEIRDFNTESNDPDDFPSFVKPVSASVAKGKFERGIVLGRTGNCEAIVLNRIRGIRCALCWDTKSAELSRKHNDANILSIGEDMISPDDALDIVRIWLKTPFLGSQFPSKLDKASNADSTRAETNAKEKQEPSSEEYDVLISFGYIIYSEGKNSTEFKLDPGLKGPTVINIPSPEKWVSEVGQWAEGRRDMVIDRLKTKCAHMPFELKEY